jgi:hypothetical protein
LLRANGTLQPTSSVLRRGSAGHPNPGGTMRQPHWQRQLARHTGLTAVLVCSMAGGCGRPETFDVEAAAALPSPAGRVVRAASVQELQRAVRDVQSATTILVEPGRYVLTEPLVVGAGRSVAPLERIAIRGSTDNRDDVVFDGAGIEIGAAHETLVANLSIANTSGQSIHIMGEAGAERPHIYNVRFADATGAMIRASAGADAADETVDDGIVEYSVFEYTRTVPSRGPSSVVSVSGGKRWVLRHNVFRDISGRHELGRRLRLAIAFRAGSADAQTYNNLFVDCDRSIAYGMAQNDGVVDNTGGSIYNNFIVRQRGVRGDAGISLWGSPGTRVYHNTVIQNGTYERPIEYRYSSTKDVDIRNNLTDGPIAARDGARAMVAGNYMKALPEMFRNPRVGDLRLLESASQAIDRGVVLPGFAFDWDGEQRPAGRRPDIGADERRIGGSTAPPDLR